MFVIGVTGGIGCGKSTVSTLLAEYGLPVVDADELSRQSTAAGGGAIEAIRRAFGEEMIAPDGAVDREKMADLVFRDKNKIDLLSSIVHEQVIAALLKAVEAAQKAGEKAIVLDVPIPVKRGFLDICDYILVVWADDEIRLERLEARGMSAAEARRRMKLQMSREEYERLGHETLLNNGDRAELTRQISRFAAEQLETRGIV